MLRPGERQDNVKLWRDAALGSHGVDLLSGDFYTHRYRPHFHEELVVATFVGGAQRHRVGRYEGVAVPGNILVIPAGETHTGQAASKDGGWSYRAFYPDLETLKALRGELFEGRAGQSLDFSKAPLQQHSRLARRLAQLHALIEQEPDPLGRQQAFANAMAAVTLHLLRARGSIREPRRESRSIRHAVEYARAHFMRPELDITELAGAAQLSVYHFMRSFRAAKGLTAHQYVVQLRLREACNFLARGMSASEVANSVGFADQSHLIRHFRAAYGVTPGSFARETQRRLHPLQ